MLIGHHQDSDIAVLAAGITSQFSVRKINRPSSLSGQVSLRRLIWETAYAHLESNTKNPEECSSWLRIRQESKKPGQEHVKESRRQ